MSTPAPESPPEPQVPGGGTGPTGPLLAVLTAVVVAVLAVPVAIGIVHAARGDGFDDSAPPVSPSAAQPSAQPSAKPSGQPSAKPTAKPSHRPSHRPSHQPSRTPSASPTAPVPTVACWDGSRAPVVSACSEPQGEDGLTWVFPSIAGQHCSQATSSGPDGLVQRRICRAHTAAGQRVVIVYAQWTSVAAAVTYVKGKGLTAVAPGTGVQQFLGSGPDGAKAAQVYTEEPFSYIATVASGDVTAAVGEVVTSRPPDQVRGQPWAASPEQPRADR